MRKHMFLRILVLAILAAFLLPHTAHAYMDPGTAGGVFSSSGAIWALIAPFIAMGVAVLGFMIRPVRIFFTSLIGKLVGGSRAEPIEADEQQASGDLPEGDGNGENTSDELRS